MTLIPPSVDTNSMTVAEVADLVREAKGREAARDALADILKLSLPEARKRREEIERNARLQYDATDEGQALQRLRRDVDFAKKRYSTSTISKAAPEHRAGLRIISDALR